MISALISRLIILAFGTLYPAYSSYKAVRTRDVKEYVKWMMYWIVFALFTFVETFTDVLFSFWFPFYYEFKVAIVFWLLSPATKGSSFLYRNFVHPALQKRENEIDDYLAQAKEKGYSTVMQIGSKGMTYATNMIVQTALKGGGGIMDHLRKSYSLSDLAPRGPRPHSGKSQSQDSSSRPQDITDSSKDERRASSRNRRSVNMSSSIDMYFSEVDVAVRHPPQPSDILSEIRSSEDISSGYSSTDQLYGEGVLTRASSVSLRGVRGRSTSISTRQTSRRAPLTDEILEEDDFYPGEDVIIRHPYSYQVPRQIMLDERQIMLERLHSPMNEGSMMGSSNDLSEYSEYAVNELPLDDSIKEVCDINNHTEYSELLNKNTESSRRSSQSSVFSDAAESVDSMSLKSFGSSNMSIDSSNDPMRGGRYKKLRAPPPPPSEKPSAPELAASIISDVSAALNLNTSTPPIPRRSKESDV